MKDDAQMAIEGMLVATLATLRALVISHPDLNGFVREFRREREETLALLLAKSQSEKAIDACREFWERIVTSAEPDDQIPR